MKGETQTNGVLVNLTLRLHNNLSRHAFYSVHPRNTKATISLGSNEGGEAKFK